MMEAYKIQNLLTPPIRETILERKIIPYNLWNPQEFVTQRDVTVNYGLESLSNDCHNYGLLVLEKYEQTNSVNQFKSNLKS